MVNSKELNKLPPEERLKRLKLMEETRKKEAKEIGRLIKDSMQELKIAKIAEKITPGQRDVDISNLFVPSSNTLEGSVAAQPDAEEGPGYRSVGQLYNDYSQLRALYSSVAQGNQLSGEHAAIIGTIGERVNLAEKHMTESEKNASRLDASRQILYKLTKESGLN